MPTDTRQPAARATGSASSGGTAVLTDRATEYDAVTAPMRSGKYRFTSGGSRTLPMPMPPSASADQTRNTGMFGDTARSSWPTTANAIARMIAGSSPSLRPIGAARVPKTANAATGIVPSRPTCVVEIANVSRSWPTIGETAATASRRFSPTRTMAASTTRRPRHGATMRPGTGADVITGGTPDLARVGPHIILRRSGVQPDRRC